MICGTTSCFPRIALAPWSAPQPHRRLSGMVDSREWRMMTNACDRQARSAGSSRSHVLVIDDDPAVLALFRELLEEEGFQVSIHSSIDRNLEEIKMFAPDLIVLDYLWAYEDACWSLLQMLRNDPATTALPILLCTGAVHKVGVHQNQLAAMDIGVVLKPFNIDELVMAIRGALCPFPVTALRDPFRQAKPG
jgi:CheY-like chemotaxis protein